MQDYRLIRSKRKTLSLQIDEEARLIVRAPIGASIKTINDYIKKKSSWIKKNKESISHKNAAVQNNKRFKDGKEVYYLGEVYEMRINGLINSITIEDNYIQFPYKFLDDPKKHIVKWYKKMATEYIFDAVEYYAKVTKRKYKKIGITSAQKRWGSCNTNGNINFSYMLIMAPKDVVDYVIIHELMHLSEPNHSNSFWSLVESYMPDYKVKRKWLKDNRHKLQI